MRTWVAIYSEKLFECVFKNCDSSGWKYKVWNDICYRCKKRVEFENAIKQSAYSVVVEIVFDIVTDKRVVTQCKCISHCDGKNCANQITWEDKDPKLFFYGHNVANINELKIAGEEENHG